MLAYHTGVPVQIIECCIVCCVYLFPKLPKTTVVVGIHFSCTKPSWTRINHRLSVLSAGFSIVRKNEPRYAFPRCRSSTIMSTRLSWSVSVNNACRAQRSTMGRHISSQREAADAAHHTSMWCIRRPTTDR